MKNHRSFFKAKALSFVAVAAVVCSLFASTSVYAMQPIDQFIVASSNVLFQGPYKKWSRKERTRAHQDTPILDLQTRTETFERSLKQGELSDADILVFQEWPYKRYSDQVMECNTQIRRWNRLLKDKPYFEFLTTPDRFKNGNFAHGIAIAYDTRKFKVRKYKGNYVTLIRLGQGLGHHALCVVLEYKTRSGATRTVGVVGCHFKYGNRGSRMQEGQAQRAVAAAPQNVDSLIICGDLNWPRRFNEATPFFRQKGFTNLTGVGGHTCLSSASNAMETVDYMFYKGDLHRPKLKITSDNKELLRHHLPGVRPGRENDFFFSDHKILKGTFDVERQLQPQPTFTIPQQPQPHPTYVNHDIQNMMNSIFGTQPAPQQPQQNNLDRIMQEQQNVLKEINLLEDLGATPIALRLLKKEQTRLERELNNLLQ